jgi:hypothetical protein
VAGVAVLWIRGPFSPAGRRKAAVRQDEWTGAALSRSAKSAFSQRLDQSGPRIESPLLSLLSDSQSFCVTNEGLLICLGDPEV